MSKANKKLIKLSKNDFIDRNLEDNGKFPELIIRLNTIDSVLLLLDSLEEMVLLNALKHVMDYVRKSDDTISVLKEKKLLQLLLQKEIFLTHSNVLIRRLSLYLASFIIENINCLVDLDNVQQSKLVGLSLSYYVQEDDVFCCEYLSVIINKCLNDPRRVEDMLKDSLFVSKYLSTIATTTDPDVLLHSLEMLHKILSFQSCEEKSNLVALSPFPVERLLCELNFEHFEIRKAALKVIHMLLFDVGASSILNQNNFAILLLKQLTKLFCESTLPEELILLVEVLATALEHESLISSFFELNLFEKYLERVNDAVMERQTICSSLLVLVKCAKSKKFLPRLVAAEVTEKLLDCLLNGDENPSAHILLGLNYLTKSPTAFKLIVASYDRDLLKKIIKLLSLKEINMKASEQAAFLLENLLFHEFHKTAKSLLDLKLSSIVSNLFEQEPKKCSVDLLLSILNIIETVAANSDYKTELCKHSMLIKNLGKLLKNSFTNALLVARLFRSLCCFVDEQEVHEHLFSSSLCSSLRKALQSPSNQVKTAVTNFIIQTSRFPKFITFFEKAGVLDELLTQQEHVFCVPTWKPAIESILSKNLTLKFCIRNSLDFNDVIVGVDFMVSKRKFKDYRVFQCILEEDVSPLQPVIVVNFNRTKNPEELVVKVPASCFNSGNENREPSDKEWCYCRSPGDEFLPQYLQEVINLLQAQNLTINPLKIGNGIDFANLARRAKVIAQVVEKAMGTDLKLLDLNTTEQCSKQTVKSHLRDLCKELHCSFIPLGRIRSGCKFERAILFKALADQVGLPCTLQRSLDGCILFNELALSQEKGQNLHCAFIPWRMLRPTHIVDLMYNVGELYPLQSRQTLQYLRLF